jgi:hypothetical protein
VLESSSPVVDPPQEPEPELPSLKPVAKVKGPAARGPAPRGTLAALTAVPSPSSSSSSSSQPAKPSAQTTVDLQKDEWRAPQDQDGSGKTKLNEKFAGRY